MKKPRPSVVLSSAAAAAVFLVFVVPAASRWWYDSILLRRLASGNEEERRQAAERLASRGSIKALDLLLEPETFEMVGPDPAFEIAERNPEEAIRILLNAGLRSDRAAVRYAAAYILGDRSLVAGRELTVVNHLVSGLRDSDCRVRKMCAGALCAGPAPFVREAVGDLKALLKADHCQGGDTFFSWDGSLGYPVAMYAVIALCQLGGEARSAIPALTEALEASDVTVRKEAQRALERIRGS